MDKIPLVKTIEVLCAELIDAVAMVVGETIQFPIGSKQLEFQVGVTRSAFLSSGEPL